MFQSEFQTFLDGLEGKLCKQCSKTYPGDAFLRTGRTKFMDCCSDECYEKIETKYAKIVDQYFSQCWMKIFIVNRVAHLTVLSVTSLLLENQS